MRKTLNQISSKHLAKFSRNAMKQTITTNEGVLECGELTVMCLICIKLFETAF